MIKNKLLKNRIIYVVLLILSIVYFVFANDGISIGIFLILLILPISSLFITLLMRHSIKLRMNLFKDKKLHIECNHFIPLMISFKIYNCLIDYRTNQMEYLFSKNYIVSFSDLLLGKNKIEVDCIVLTDYFFLFSFNVKFNYKGEINKYPQIKNLNLNFEKNADDSLESEMYKSSSVLSISKNYSTYREYIKGDSLKSINWKLLSKLNKLFVKVEEEKIQDKLVLIFNYNISIGNIDLLEIFISCSFNLLENNVTHTLVFNSKNDNKENSIFIGSHDDLEKAIDYIIGCNLAKFEDDSILLNQYNNQSLIVVGERLNYQRSNVTYLFGEELYE